jgi:PAT family beta-lactamase induction signal transducer AmpG
VIASAGIIGWNAALGGVAALIALGVVVTLLTAEPNVTRESRGIAVQRGLLARVRHAVVEPLTEFLSRPGALVILAFIALFKLDEAMAGVMTAPFYRSLGFDRAAIAVANFLPSLAAVLAGTAIGGFLVARLGVGRALLITGLVQSSVMGMYVVLAYSPGQVGVLYGTVFIESFAGGLADAAFIAYLSGLCSVAFTATQYALLSSVAAIGLRTIGGFTGFLAEAVGFPVFYMICTLAAWPSMGIMIWLLRRYPPVEKKGKG